MSRMECGQPGTFPVDVVLKSFLERYGERLLSSLKARSTSTSMSLLTCQPVSTCLSTLGISPTMCGHSLHVNPTGEMSHMEYSRLKEFLRLHVRMSKKSGWLHGEVDAFDSHE